MALVVRDTILAAFRRYRGQLNAKAPGAITVDTGSLGYSVGSGGTVVQATTVTLNKPSGRVEMHPETLAAWSSVQF